MGGEGREREVRGGKEREGKEREGKEREGSGVKWEKKVCVCGGGGGGEGRKRGGRNDNLSEQKCQIRCSYFEGKFWPPPLLQQCSY